jgi:hypothetical protein
MNSAKKNYTTIENEVLAMIYAMKKVRQYLLGNSFFFFFFGRSSSIIVFVEQTNSARSNF